MEKGPHVMTEQLKDYFKAETLGLLEDRYRSYKEKLPIDKDALDDEFFKQPTVLMQISEELVILGNVKARMKRELDSYTASFREQVRLSEEKVTRDELSDRLTLDTRYKKLVRVYDAIDRLCGLYYELRVAWTERGSSLRHVNQLIGNGQFPDAGVRGRRR